MNHNASNPVQTHPGQTHLSRDQFPFLGHDDHLARFDIAHPREADWPKGAVLRGNAPIVSLGAGTLAKYKGPGVKECKGSRIMTQVTEDERSWDTLLCMNMTQI